MKGTGREDVIDEDVARLGKWRADNFELAYIVLVLDIHLRNPSIKPVLYSRPSMRTSTPCTPSLCVPSKPLRWLSSKSDSPRFFASSGFRNDVGGQFVSQRAAGVSRAFQPALVASGLPNHCSRLLRKTQEERDADGPIVNSTAVECGQHVNILPHQSEAGLICCLLTIFFRCRCRWRIIAHLEDFGFE